MSEGHNGNGIGTPKPAGEVATGRRRVTSGIAFITYFIIHKMVFPSVSFHPSSHFVLLACRLRDSRYRFPALNANTGLTPCAVIYPPFRGHCVMSWRCWQYFFCTILCRDAPWCVRLCGNMRRCGRTRSALPLAIGFMPAAPRCVPTTLSAVIAQRIAGCTIPDRHETIQKPQGLKAVITVFSPCGLRWSDRESNPDLIFRRDLFYPLNYQTIVRLWRNSTYAKAVQSYDVFLNYARKTMTFSVSRYIFCRRRNHNIRKRAPNAFFISSSRRFASMGFET